MTLNGQGFLEFGPYRLDLVQRVLLRGADVVPLPPKAYETLLLLARGKGQILEKEEMMQALWPGTFVEEGNLTQVIFQLRRALGDSPQDPGYIVTVPRRGYRFAPDVHEVAAQQPASALAPPRRSLRKMLVPAALVLAAFVGFYFARPRPSAIHSVVVLPFLNLSTDPNNEYFSDGLTEEVINSLAAVPGLKVVARTSAFQFKGKNVDIRRVGEQLGADAVLEGSVRVEGDHLRVTAQLNNTRDGYHYWSRAWDHGMKDVLAVQAEVAQEVAHALSPRTPLPPPKAISGNAAAYDLYLQGMYHYGRIGQFNPSLEAFDGALKLDGNFAAAHAQIARAYTIEVQMGRVAPAVGITKIREHTAKALQIDPNLALGHASSAMLAFLFDWDFPAAERSFRRALELRPADPDVHHDYAHFLTAMGRFEEAMTHSRQSVDLDPLSVTALSHIVWQNFYYGDLQTAAAAARPALNVDPNFSLCHLYLEWVFEEMGDFRKAAAEIGMHPFFPKAGPKVLAGFESSGGPGYWRAYYDLALSSPGTEASRARSLAKASVHLGRKEEVLGWLRKLLELHDTSMVYAAVQPEYGPLRHEPEFQRILKRIGLR